MRVIIRRRWKLDPRAGNYLFRILFLQRFDITSYRILNISFCFIFYSPGITWIASEAWAESDAILNFPPHVVLGSLGVKLVSKFSGINKRLCRSPHTKNNIWLTPFLCQYHNISQQNCSVRSLLEKSQINSWCFQSLFPPSMMYIWSFAENAIRTVAQALDDLVSGSTKKTFDYAAMLKSIKSMTFIDSSSRAVSYTNYVGFSVVNYTVVNLQSIDSNGRLKFIQVGSWAKDISKQNKSSKTLVLCKSSIQWNTGTFFTECFFLTTFRIVERNIFLWDVTYIRVLVVARSLVSVCVDARIL